MTTSPLVEKDHVALLLLAAAGAWALLVLVVGSVVLVPENGRGVVITLSIPLLLVGLFAVALLVRRARHRDGPGAVAWTVAGLSALFALLGVLTIGVFVLPVALVLFVVCGRAQEHRRARS